MRATDELEIAQLVVYWEPVGSQSLVVILKMTLLRSSKGHNYSRYMHSQLSTLLSFGSRSVCVGFIPDCLTATGHNGEDLAPFRDSSVKMLA